MNGLSFQVSRSEAIAGRQDALTAYLRLVVAGRRWALDHPVEYVRALAAEIGLTEPVATAEVLKRKSKRILLIQGKTISLHAVVMSARLAV